MSEPSCGLAQMPFEVCQRLVIDAANELIAEGRFKKLIALAALTPSDVRQLPNGAITISLRSVDGAVITRRCVDVKNLVEGEQFLRNAVTVNLMTWLRDSFPAKAVKKTNVSRGKDARRHRRVWGRR